MKRVAHIITGLDVGGAERALHNVLMGGLQARYSNCVISLTGLGHYGPLLRGGELEVICLNMSRGDFGPAALWRLHKAIKSVQPDIIQGWMYHGNLAALAASTMYSRRSTLLWNIRLSLEGLQDMKRLTQAVIWIGMRTSSLPNAIIYNSVRSRVQHERYGYAPAASAFIPNGFDTDSWHPDVGAARRLREELHIPQGGKILGFVGRAHRQKDLPNLFAAFAEVARGDPTVHLVCVGRGIEAAVPSGLDPARLRILGERNDVPQIMPGFSVLCLSSQVEGFPNVIGEAMACGVPCVSTDVGDAAAVVGNTGWIVKPRDTTSLTNALMLALSEADSERKARGNAARERIIERYSLASVTRAYDVLYSQLLQAA